MRGRRRGAPGAAEADAASTAPTTHPWMTGDSLASTLQRLHVVPSSLRAASAGAAAAAASGDLDSTDRHNNLHNPEDGIGGIPPAEREDDDGRGAVPVVARHSGAAAGNTRSNSNSDRDGDLDRDHDDDDDDHDHHYPAYATQSAPPRQYDDPSPSSPSSPSSSSPRGGRIRRGSSSNGTVTLPSYGFVSSECEECGGSSTVASVAASAAAAAATATVASNAGGGGEGGGSFETESVGCVGEREMVASVCSSSKSSMTVRSVSEQYNVLLAGATLEGEGSAAAAGAAAAGGARGAEEEEEEEESTMTDGELASLRLIQSERMLMLAEERRRLEADEEIAKRIQSELNREAVGALSKEDEEIASRIQSEFNREAGGVLTKEDEEIAKKIQSELNKEAGGTLTKEDEEIAKRIQSELNKEAVGALSKEDEEMAKRMQSELNKEALGKDWNDPEVRRKRKQMLELDEKFADRLKSLEEINMKRYQKDREEQLARDEAMAKAEYERERQRVSSTGDADGPAISEEVIAERIKQEQLDNELARMEAARDETRREMHQKSTAHDEQVARAENARESAAQEVNDEVVAQTLQEDQQAQHHHQQQQHRPPGASSPSQPRHPPSVPPIGNIERQLRLSGCTVREITEVEEIRRDNELQMRCAICLEPYVLGDTVRTLPCFHSFHTRCIDTWICSKGTCPIDKNPCL